MTPIVIAMLCCFGFASSVHLYFCFVENEKMRFVTKPLCVFFLFLAAVIALPNNPLIYLGALLGVVGDVFLLFNKNQKLFVIGTIFFLAGHFLYITQLALVISYSYNLPYYFYIILVGIGGLFTVLMYPFISKLCGKIAWIGGFYIFTLIAEIIMAVITLVLLGMSAWPAILFMLGAIFFLGSDLTLSQATFKKDFPRRDFPIMLTYLIGELGLVLGLIYLFI